MKRALIAVGAVIVAAAACVALISLLAFYPKVPLVLNTALGIAIMSYDGRVFFGLLGDYDALADIDALAADLDAAITELAEIAGAPVKRARGRRAPARA